MQEGFPLRNKILNRGYSIDWGGDGRYMYVLRYNNPRQVSVFDMSLLTAANYAGAGSWTVNPLITTITLTGTTAADLCFISKSKEIIVTGSNNCVRIDANPNSGTFNTNLGLYGVNVGFGSNCVYDPISNAVFQPASGFKKLLAGANGITGGGFIATNDTGWNTFATAMLVDHYNGIIHGTSNGRGNSIYSCADILNLDKFVQIAQWNLSTNSGGCGVSDNYWYTVDNGLIRVYTKEIYPKFVAVISAIGFQPRMHFNAEYNYLVSFTTSTAVNNISIINNRSLNVAATLSKGTILNGETNNARAISYRNVLVTNSNLPHFHVFDLATLSYVGYYDFVTGNTRIANNILTT